MKRDDAQPRSRGSLLGFLYGIVGIWCVSVCSVRPDVPRELETAQDLIQEMLRNVMPQWPQTTTNTKTSPSSLETCDLMQASDRIMKEVASGPEYAAYVRRRKDSLSPEQIKALDPKAKGMWMVEYAQSREDVKPEIKAWLYVMGAPFVPWDQALVAYHRLEKYRPQDFVPALMMAFKVQAPGVDPPTLEQWKDLIRIVRQAVPLATNTEEMTDCVVALGMGALKLDKTRSGQVPLQIWQWMRDVQLPEPQKDPVNALRLNLVKMYVAMAAQDYAAAIDIAPRCGMQIFQPKFFVLAGKREEACEALQKMRLDRTLRELEQVGLRKLEPLILMFAHQFDKAGRVIGEQRENPKLTAEDSKWLETMEQLLRNYESGVRSRGNKQP